jgi:hypothetical protein
MKKIVEKEVNTWMNESKRCLFAYLLHTMPSNLINSFKVSYFSVLAKL